MKTFFEIEFSLEDAASGNEIMICEMQGQSSMRKWAVFLTKRAILI